MSKLVGLVGWRGMVGSVLMDRMVTGNAARGYPTQYGAPTDRQGGTAADASGPDRRATRDVEDFADALAAELDMEIAAMDPVNLTTGRVEHPRGAEGKPASYDAWDDEALDQFLDEYDLDGVEPTFHPIGGLSNVMREDEVQEGFSQEVALENAPKQQDGYFLIPSILGEGGDR